MAVTKPIASAVTALPAQAVTVMQTPTTREAAKPVTAKKPVVKKAVPAKPPVKKRATTQTPATQAAVKKPAAKTPLSKVFANASPAKAAEAAKVVKVVKAVRTAPIAKLEKTKKPKLVRDSFTIPKAEYMVLETLKQRATKLTRSVKKSELLRAGIKALAALSDAAFLTALAQVPAIKTGRPAAAK